MVGLTGCKLLPGQYQIEPNNSREIPARVPKATFDFCQVLTRLVAVFANRRKTKRSTHQRDFLVFRHLRKVLEVLQKKLNKNSIKIRPKSEARLKITSRSQGNINSYKIKAKETKKCPHRDDDDDALLSRVSQL
jgi:hypothetical protein